MESVEKKVRRLRQMARTMEAPLRIIRREGEGLEVCYGDESASVWPVWYICTLRHGEVTVLTRTIDFNSIHQELLYYWEVAAILDVLVD